MMKTICTLTALLGALTVPATQAATLYRAVDLGTLQQGPTYAYGINNLGQVTGSSEVKASNSSFYQRQAFVSTNGTMAMLHGGSGTVVRSSVGRDINDAGQVVGTAGFDAPLSGPDRAFVTVDGVIPEKSNLSFFSNGYGINNSGAAVGNMFQDFNTHAFVVENGSAST